MSTTDKIRDWSIHTAGIIFGAIIISWGAWVWWPYPAVTASGTAVVQNLPKEGYYRTGDLIRWTIPEVCQPAGRTDVVIYAVLDFKGEAGARAESRTEVVYRGFNISGFPECVKDNPTSVYVDGDLPTGTYRFEVEACIYSGGPKPTCDTFQGPKDVKIVRVTRNEPEGFVP